MNTSNKILSKQQLINLVESWRENGEKIVFTNGCFDILHYGHLCLLNKSAAFGTKLIVAINSDSSVKKLKGENRPINNELHRAALIAALEVVNATVIFEEETPAALIAEIKPSILVKGGDYTVSQIAGADFVLKNGGEVKIIPLEKNLSTTKILSSLNRK